jgi:hypothetical protein
MHRTFIKKAVTNKGPSQIYAIIRKKNKTLYSFRFRNVILSGKGCQWSPAIDSETMSRFLTDIGSRNEEFIAFVRVSITSRNHWSQGVDGDANLIFPEIPFIVYNCYGKYYIQKGSSNKKISLTTKSRGPY